MKQIPLLQGKALLVEMDKFTDFDCPMELHGNRLVSSQSKGLVMNTTKIPPGNWRIIGMLSEVTEKTLSTVLDSAELNEGRRLYNIHGEPYPNRLTDSALESLESAILAEGWYFENPHGDEPKPENTSNYAYSVDVRIWEAAQSRVLDRSRCLLLGRESKTPEFMGFKIERE